MSKRKAIRLDSGQIEVVDEVMAQVFRQKTPAERLKVGFAIWTSAHNMLRSHLKNNYPNWSNKRIEKEASRRFSRGFQKLHFRLGKKTWFDGNMESGTEAPQG